MQITRAILNTTTGTSPYVLHFPGKTLQKPEGQHLFSGTFNLPLGSSIPSDLEIVTCADRQTAAESHLIRQCARFGIPITVLGATMDRNEYLVRHHFNKPHLLRDHIDSGAAKPYLLVVDASDILFARSLSGLLDDYHARWPDRPILFGAEKHYMYKMAMWNGYAIGVQTSSLEEKTFVKRASEERSLPQYPWKYLNGGMMLAPRDVLRSALDKCLEIADRVPPGVYKCDQSIWMYLWTHGIEPRISIDFSCALFQNCNYASPHQVVFVDSCLNTPAQIESLVDAVYLYCGNDNGNLAYSIASIRENLVGLGRIFVYGSDPNLPGVIHVPFPDPNVFNREANMTRKVLAACANPAITDPFILLSDDHFVMKPVSAKTLPLMYKGDLSATKRKSLYSERTHQTYLELVRMGLPTLNYNVHCPMRIEKKAYMAALAMVQWDTDFGCGVLCRSIYGNYVGGGTFQEDAKRLAKTAIAAMSGAYLSLPNRGGEPVLAYIREKFGGKQGDADES